MRCRGRTITGGPVRSLIAAASAGRGHVLGVTAGLAHWQLDHPVALQGRSVVSRAAPASSLPPASSGALSTPYIFPSLLADAGELTHTGGPGSAEVFPPCWRWCREAFAAALQRDAAVIVRIYNGDATIYSEDEMYHVPPSAPTLSSAADAQTGKRKGAKGGASKRNSKTRKYPKKSCEAAARASSPLPPASIPVVIAVNAASHRYNDVFYRPNPHHPLALHRHGHQQHSEHGLALHYMSFLSYIHPHIMPPLELEPVLAAMQGDRLDGGVENPGVDSYTAQRREPQELLRIVLSPDGTAIDGWFINDNCSSSLANCSFAYYNGFRMPGVVSNIDFATSYVASMLMGGSREYLNRRKNVVTTMPHDQSQISASPSSQAKPLRKEVNPEKAINPTTAVLFHHDLVAAPQLHCDSFFNYDLNFSHYFPSPGATVTRPYTYFYHEEPSRDATKDQHIQGATTRKQLNLQYPHQSIRRALGMDNIINSVTSIGSSDEPSELYSNDRDTSLSRLTRDPYAFLSGESGIDLDRDVDRHYPLVSMLQKLYDKRGGLGPSSRLRSHGEDGHEAGAGSGELHKQPTTSGASRALGAFEGQDMLIPDNGYWYHEDAEDHADAAERRLEAGSAVAGDMMRPVDFRRWIHPVDGREGRAEASPGCGNTERGALDSTSLLQPGQTAEPQDSKISKVSDSFESWSCYADHSYGGFFYYSGNPLALGNTYMEDGCPNVVPTGNVFNLENRFRLSRYRMLMLRNSIQRFISFVKRQDNTASISAMVTARVGRVLGGAPNDTACGRGLALAPDWLFTSALPRLRDTASVAAATPPATPGFSRVTVPYTTQEPWLELASDTLLLTLPYWLNKNGLFSSGGLADSPISDLPNDGSPKGADLNFSANGANAILGNSNNSNSSNQSSELLMLTLRHALRQSLYVITRDFSPHAYAREGGRGCRGEGLPPYFPVIHRGSLGPFLRGVRIALMLRLLQPFRAVDGILAATNRNHLFSTIANAHVDAADDKIDALDTTSNACDPSERANEDDLGTPAHAGDAINCDIYCECLQDYSDFMELLLFKLDPEKLPHTLGFANFGRYCDALTATDLPRRITDAIEVLEASLALLCLLQQHSLGAITPKCRELCYANEYDAWNSEAASRAGKLRSLITALKEGIETGITALKPGDSEPLGSAPDDETSSCCGPYHLGLTTVAAPTLIARLMRVEMLFHQLKQYAQVMPRDSRKKTTNNTTKSVNAKGGPGATDNYYARKAHQFLLLFAAAVDSDNLTLEAIRISDMDAFSQRLLPPTDNLSFLEPNYFHFDKMMMFPEGPEYRSSNFFFLDHTDNSDQAIDSEPSKRRKAKNQAIYNASRALDANDDLEDISIRLQLRAEQEEMRRRRAEDEAERRREVEEIERLNLYRLTESWGFSPHSPVNGRIASASASHADFGGAVAAPSVAHGRQAAATSYLYSAVFDPTNPTDNLFRGLHKDTDGSGRLAVAAIMSGLRPVFTPLWNPRFFSSANSYYADNDTRCNKLVASLLSSSPFQSMCNPREPHQSAGHAALYPGSGAVDASSNRDDELMRYGQRNMANFFSHIGYLLLSCATNDVSEACTGLLLPRCPMGIFLDHLEDDKCCGVLHASFGQSALSALLLRIVFVDEDDNVIALSDHAPSLHRVLLDCAVMRWNFIPALVTLKLRVGGAHKSSDTDDFQARTAMWRETLQRFRLHSPTSVKGPFAEAETGTPDTRHSASDSSRSIERISPEATVPRQSSTCELLSDLAVLSQEQMITGRAAPINMFIIKLVEILHSICIDGHEHLLLLLLRATGPQYSVKLAIRLLEWLLQNVERANAIESGHTERGAVGAHSPSSGPEVAILLKGFYRVPFVASTPEEVVFHCFR